MSSRASLGRPADSGSLLAGQVADRSGLELGERGSRCARAHVSVFVTGAVATGLVAYQLALPNVLGGVRGYDEGVYLGATLRLLGGVTPYRDFAFLHPPGLPLLLSPVVALADLPGEHAALVVARLVTAAAAVGAAALAACVLRHWGAGAVLVTGLVAAVLPAAVSADSALLLDPYMVLFCMIGAVVVFDRTGAVAASARRVAIGGAAFGFACAIKAPAVLAVLALLAVLGVARPGWRRSGALLGGVLAGAGLPSLPFLALAPGAFVHDVVVTQLVRAPAAGIDPPLAVAQRLGIITGLADLPGLHPPGVWAVVVVAVLGVLALAALVGRAARAVDVFVVAAAGAVVAGMCVVGWFSLPYGYFPGFFLALAAGVVAGRGGELLKSGWSRWRSSGHLRARPLGGDRLARRAAWAATAGALALALLVANEDAAFARSYLGHSSEPGAQLALRIEPGSCVVFDEDILAISANRFPASGRCPVIVDPFGQWLADDPAHPPPYAGPYSPALVRRWMGALRRADYLVEVAPRSDFIPWAQQLAAYLQSRFVMVYSAPGAVLYERTSELYRP